ncbi:ATP-dependent DNA helicase RecG [Alphaproteobacteria bacterium]|nr:ATP-dependent DNA helicase RecG [Alphaproteobacteria bacterium]
MHISRPDILFSLFARLTSLPGIGPKMADQMAKRIGVHVIDLLRHLPVGVNDRRARPSVVDVEEGSLATFDVLVLSADIPPARVKRPARFRVETNGGEMDILFFHAQTDYLKNTLPVGERRLISGRVERFQNRVQMAHPDYILSPANTDDMPAFEPLYPLTAGLKAKPLRKALSAGLERLRDMPEWIDKQVMADYHWPDFKTAMTVVHAPRSLSDISANAPARMRLAFDELFANQLALQLLRQQTDIELAGHALMPTGALSALLRQTLPFTLTPAQEKVLSEIDADQRAPLRMLRLLQGDVGSGKTMVALLAMLSAVEAGGQTALLVPTEVLARQHQATLTGFLAPLGIKPELLLGGQKPRERAAILDGLETGAIRIVIGTHALLNDDVVFSALRLAVVDEQHRFGVRQRLILGQKGDGCDVLVMTATPIPRTLEMTAFGDLSVSRLDEKPAGRQEIATALVNHDRIGDVVERLRAALSGGMRAYWICPLVEETEKLDATAAEDRHRHLCTLLPDAHPVLAHGQMKSVDRDAAMQAFTTGASRLLVATTIIEVGVDVPEAGIIIIEHAERFGLAQLHQLRGRVGRGNIASSCILMYQGPLSETAGARLKIMRNTNDGFEIAEEDLRLRGPGEVLGSRQSGMPEFSLADLSEHAPLLSLARDEAHKAVAAGRSLDDKDIVTLLSLFEKDSAVRFLASG